MKKLSNIYIKTKNKYIYYVILFIISCLYIYQYKINNDLLDIQNSNIKQLISLEEVLLSTTFSNENDMRSSKFTSLIDDSEKYTFTDLDTNSIYIYYNEQQCIPCLASVQKVLQSLKENNFDIPVNYIFSFERYNVCKTFSENMSIPEKIYHTKDVLKFTDLNINTPYIFFLDKNRNIKYIHCYSKNNPLFTKKYFRILEKLVSE